MAKRNNERPANAFSVHGLRILMEKVFTKLMEIPVKTSWTTSWESQAESSFRKKKNIYIADVVKFAFKFLILTPQCLYADLPTAN